MTQERFAEAYNDGHLRTISFLISKGFSRDTAEETAQAAWVRGWERRTQLRDPHKALPWVNSIALNIGRDGARHERERCELSQEPTAPRQSFTAHIDAERALARCPQQDRILLEKRYFGECNVDELAQEWQCSNMAMRVRLHRVRSRLRKRLEATPASSSDLPPRRYD